MVTKSKVVRTIETPVEEKAGATVKYSLADLAKVKKRLALRDRSVSEIEVTGVLHLLDLKERIAFYNECHRVLKKGGKVKALYPHWQSSHYYTDPTVPWPPLVEHFFFHLNAEYRDKNPSGVKGIVCDFDSTWGYGMHPAIATRNQEYQQHAIMFWKESAQTVITTSVKR